MRAGPFAAGLSIRDDRVMRGLAGLVLAHADVVRQAPRSWCCRSRTTMPKARAGGNISWGSESSEPARRAQPCRRRLVGRRFSPRPPAVSRCSAMGLPSLPRLPELRLDRSGDRFAPRGRSPSSPAMTRGRKFAPSHPAAHESGGPRRKFPACGSAAPRSRVSSMTSRSSCGSRRARSRLARPRAPAITISA